MLSCKCYLCVSSGVEHTCCPANAIIASPAGLNIHVVLQMLPITFQAGLSMNVALQMLDYNVPGGKLNRGMAVADALLVIKGKQV